MAVNTAQIRQLLEPGLWKVSGDYERKPTVWSKLFTTRRAKLATERRVQVRLLGLPALKAEGAATTFDNGAGTRYTYNATTFEISLGFALTRKSMDDNQYTSDFSQSSMGLANSFKEYKEIVAANIFNTGTTYDPTIGGDGVALFSTAHPYDLGTWGNRFATDLDLNEASLLQASINIQSTWVNEAGLKINAMPEKLVVPIPLIPVAERLLKSERRPGTAENDVNAIRSMPGGLTDYIPHTYMTSSTQWFVTTNIEGLDMWERIKFETSMWTDDTTDNILVKGYERYTPSYSDPRCVYGSFPS